MTAAMNAPWYKQPWPWILMAGPGIVIVASIFTVILAVRSDDSLVATDYYKEGLAINQVLDRENLARKMQMAAQIGIKGSHIAVDLKSSGPLPAKIRVSLIHPTRAGMDGSVLLDGRDGHYEGDFPPIPTGRWDLRVTDEANTWRLGREIRLPEQNNINIVPSELANH